MSSLAMVLSGHLQSWGVDSRFSRRETGRFPTKSGVLGLLAASLGRRRTDPIEDLLHLRFGVRIDQPGTIIRDFHTARRDGESMPLSQRFYLCDAVFLAVVEGPGELIGGLADATRAPGFLPFLGRRSCPPSRPIFASVREGSMELALGEEPWHASDWYRGRRGAPEDSVTLDTVADAPRSVWVGERYPDIPLSFDPDRRRFATRGVVRGHVTLELGTPRGKPLLDHDPMSLLGGT